MTTRLPSSLGTLYWTTETTAGTYVPPAASGNVRAVSAIKSWSMTPGGQGIVRNEDDVTPVGGGGDPALGDLMWDISAEISVSGYDRAGGTSDADWEPLIRACAVAYDETPGVGDANTDSTIVVTPERGPNIPATNDQSPQVASVTWRDAGHPSVAQVLRARGVAARIASISSGSDGDIRMALEAIGLWYRGTTDPADSVTTATASGLTSPGTYIDRADAPLFRLPGAVLTVDGGTANAAEYLDGVCVQEFSFDLGMSLEAQPCLGEIDGYAPAFSYQSGQGVLSMTVAVPAEDGTDKAVMAAMLRELAGVSLGLKWTRVSGTVTWTFEIEIRRFRVLSVTRGDNAGARTYQVELCGRPNPEADTAADAPWAITWTRVEA